MCSKEVNHVKIMWKGFSGKGKNKGKGSEVGRNKLGVFRKHKEGKHQKR